jgi:hypothetical protein
MGVALSEAKVSPCATGNHLIPQRNMRFPHMRLYGNRMPTQAGFDRQFQEILLASSALCVTLAIGINRTVNGQP